jgi:hypothetical protein
MKKQYSNLLIGRIGFISKINLFTIVFIFFISCNQRTSTDADKILELFTLGEKFDNELLQSPKIHYKVFNYTDPQMLQILDGFGEKTSEDMWFYLLYDKGLWVKCNFDTLGNGILTGVTLAALVGDVNGDKPFYSYNIREDANNIITKLYKTKYGSSFKTIIADTSEANIVKRFKDDADFFSWFGSDADAENKHIQDLNEGMNTPITETIQWDKDNYTIEISTKKYPNKKSRAPAIFRTIIQYKLKDGVINKIKQSIEDNNIKSTLPKI